MRGIPGLLAWTLFSSLALAQPNPAFPQPNQPNQPNPGFPPKPPGQMGPPANPFQPGQPQQPGQMFPQGNQPNQPGQLQPPKPPPQPTLPPGPINEQNATKAANAACGTMMIVMLVVGLGSLTFTIVWIFVGMWAAKDAQARGMDNSTMWGFLVFFLGIVGLIVYLVIRPSEKGKPAAKKICRECGKKRSRALKRCPACGVA